MNQNSAPASATIRTGSNRVVVGGAGRDTLWVLGFVCVAIVIRLHGLSAANLWLDEANSWQVASGSWSKLIGELRGSPVGPLYFVLLKLWISAFGESAFALRAFSVLASVALVAVVYAVGAQLLSRRAGLVAAALTALSPLELYFAQEARMYMLTSLVALLAFWAYVCWRSAALTSLDPSSVTDANSKRRSQAWALVWYTIAATILLFTHPVTGALLVALNLDALVLWWQTRRLRDDAAAARARRSVVISWIAAQVVILAVLMLYLMFVRLDTAASSQAWRSGLGFERSLRAAMMLPFGAIAGQRYYPTDFWFALSDLMQRRGAIGRFTTLLIIQPLALLVFVAAGDAAIRERSRASHDPATAPSVQGGRRLLLFALIIPLVFAVIISITRSLETERYFLFVVPFLFLLLADGLVALEPKTRYAALAVLGLGMLLGTRSTKAAVSRDSDYRSTAALIDRERQPGDRIMIQPREMNAPLRFYLHSSDIPIGLAANASAGVELAKLTPGRTWVVIDYRSPLYTLAPQELSAALRTPLVKEAYTSDASVGVRVALVDTRNTSR